jgi:hypothetical protein
MIENTMLKLRRISIIGGGTGITITPIMAITRMARIASDTVDLRLGTPVISGTILLLFRKKI